MKPLFDRCEILIIEVNEASELLITIVVEKFGKEINNVISGVKAVAAFDNNPDIDLVLIDI